MVQGPQLSHLILIYFHFIWGEGGGEKKKRIVIFHSLVHSNCSEQPEPSQVEVGAQIGVA